MRKIEPDKLRLILFLLTFTAILYYPVSKIIAVEFPDKEPVVYEFDADMYDPYDPMHGRYVRLFFGKIETVKAPENANGKFDGMTHCYAVLGKDKNGRAVITELCTPDEIPAGKDYLRVKFRWPWMNRKNLVQEKYQIELPFNRFYLNEKLAPEAEKLLKTNYGAAVLRVKVYEDGNFAVDDLYVNGKSIRALCREKQPGK